MTDSTPRGLCAACLWLATTIASPATAAPVPDTWWIARLELIDDPVQPDPTLGAAADLIVEQLHAAAAAATPPVVAQLARPKDRVDHQEVSPAYWTALGAQHGDRLLTGSITRKDGQLELTLTLWRVTDHARQAQLTRRVEPTRRAEVAAVLEALRATADAPITTVTATRARAVEPKWVTPTVEPARPPPDTTNPWARNLIVGGSGLAAAGLVTGLVTYLAFAVPLEGPQPRSGADNDALLQTGRATGIAADAAVITGLVGAATGVVLWLAGVGEEEVR